MPAATAGSVQSVDAVKPEKSEQMWNALKNHIMRERQRKKQEQEAEVEEERLRKEREARERQDVMTLGETREQIQQLEQNLAKLKDEKHQLFLQLKKVLNEDDNRRRQFKESTDNMVIHQLQPQGMVHTQLFLPPIGGGPPTRTQHSHPMGQPQLIHKAPPQVISGAIKRGRSPSPNSMGYFKQGNYAPPKLEEGRRGVEVTRAVLWNKPSQYNNPPGTPFYQVPPPVSNDNRGAPTIMYSNYAPVITQRTESNIRQPNYHLDIKSEPGKAQQSVFINIDQKSHNDHHMGMPGEKMVTDRNYIEIKHEDRKMTMQERGVYMDKNIHGIHVGGQPPEGMVFATGIRQGQMPPILGVQIQNSQNAKPGSITTGYPIRPPQQNQQQQQQQNSGMGMYPRHRY